MQAFYELYKRWLEIHQHSQVVNDDSSTIYQIDNCALTQGDFKKLLTDCNYCRYKETDSELSPCVVCSMGMPESNFENQFILDFNRDY